MNQTLRSEITQTAVTTPLPNRVNLESNSKPRNIVTPTPKPTKVGIKMDMPDIDEEMTKHGITDPNERVYKGLEKDGAVQLWFFLKYRENFFEDENPKKYYGRKEENGKTKKRNRL